MSNLKDCLACVYESDANPTERPRLFIDEEGYGQLVRAHRRRWTPISDGYYIFVHSSNRSKLQHIKQLTELVQTDRNRNESGKLVDVWLDDTTIG